MSKDLLSFSVSLEANFNFVSIQSRVCAVSFAVSEAFFADFAASSIALLVAEPPPNWGVYFVCVAFTAFCKIWSAAVVAYSLYPSVYFPLVSIAIAFNLANCASAVPATPSCEHSAVKLFISADVVIVILAAWIFSIT